MRLTKLKITNYRSIIGDEIEFDDFTFFVGRNNYGKSNYLRAIDHLLSFGKTYGEVDKIQNDKSLPVVIEGSFSGAAQHTPRLKDSKHQKAVEELIDADGTLRLRLTIQPDGSAETLFVDPSTGEPKNVTGITTQYKKLFPEVIFVPATADTAEELQEKSTTALSKVKKEVMQHFFSSLTGVIDQAFEPVDKFLHGAERSEELANLEQQLSDEMMGEFADVKPTIHFELPDSAIIGKGMRITLDDSFHDCEIDEKGNGLQRTALFALMRLLCRHTIQQTEKPAPLFLIEELEAFLHPSAQQKLSRSLESMAKKYQTVATTHSPFVLSEKLLRGYRRVAREKATGSQATGPQKDYDEFDKNDYDVVKNALAHSDNLVSLFADVVCIVEGKDDAGFYSVVTDILGIKSDCLVSFVKCTGGGTSQLHISYKFFKLMGVDRVNIIADLDSLFDTSFKRLLETAGLDPIFIDEFRSAIEWTETGHPGLDQVLARLDKVDARQLEEQIEELSRSNIYILRQGAPEKYYSTAFANAHVGKNPKQIWGYLNQDNQLNHITELKSILGSIAGASVE